MSWFAAWLSRAGSFGRLQVFNTALMSAQSELPFDQAQADHEFWGRLTESAVGSHLLNAAAAGTCELFYWREDNHEVDFIVRAGRNITAIEVKSGRTGTAPLRHGRVFKSFSTHPKTTGRRRRHDRRRVPFTTGRPLLITLRDMAVAIPMPQLRIA